MISTFWRRVLQGLRRYILVLLLLVAWCVVTWQELLPGFLLPAPWQVLSAFLADWQLLQGHMWVTLQEAGLGLGLAVIAALALAIFMDSFRLVEETVMPLLVLSQTIPVIALAPLLVLWFGFGMAPKIILVFLVCFFPMAVGLLTAFKEVDRDILRLMTSMGASSWQSLWHVKLPAALPAFFAGLRIAVSYAVIGAVIAEWLGGHAGLGVYMTRVRRSYAFDRMFAVIILVSLISLCLIRLVEYGERKATPWRDLG